MCSNLRYLRLPDETRRPDYEYNDTYFTLEIHHKGAFVDRKNCESCYMGGKIDYFDYCNFDLMSLLEIEDVLKQLGYESSLPCYYKNGDTQPWFKLENDKQLMSYLNTNYGKSSISIYVESKAEDDPIASQVEDVVDPTPTKHIPINVLLNPFYSLVDYSVTLEVPVEIEGSDEGSDDSTELEHFSDSEYEDDDKMFDENVDMYVEWGGVREKLKAVNEIRVTDERGSDDGDDDYQTSDDLRNIDDSSDDETLKKRKRWTEFNKITGMEEPCFSLGMLFPSSKVLAEAIKMHAIKSGKQIKVKRCERKMVRAICNEGCKWMIYGSMMQDNETIQIKTFRNEHTCNRSFVNSNVTSTFLAKYYVDKIRTNPDWPITSFQEHVMQDLKVKVSTFQLYRAKKIAFKMIQGSVQEQFSRLHDYIAELKRANPGTNVALQRDVIDCNRFLRIYICLGALKMGFIGNCRPLIGMDGCHLKGCIPGKIFSAVGIDANNSMYPVAYDVVESENKPSWKWFIEHLKEDLGIVNTYGWTFITDKQKGLVPALEELCPNSEHRTCARHLYSNFKLKYKGLSLKDQFYACARATTVAGFEDEMKEMLKIDEDAFKWLNGKPPRQWSRSHFSTFTKSDMLLNNLCESFNSLIMEARDKPILTMLEKIRTILMRRIHTSRTKMLKNDGVLCPKIQQILEKTKGEAAYCVPDWAGNSKFEVDGPGGKFVCDLNNMTCDCRKWDLTGIPCKHGIAAMTYAGIEVEENVNKSYHKETYLKCYENFINPLNGPQLWPKTGLPTILPPIYHAQPRQKKKKMIPEPDEIKKKNGKRQTQEQPHPHKLEKKHQVSLKCGKCGQVGHSKRSCKSTTNAMPNNGDGRDASGTAHTSGTAHASGTSYFLQKALMPVRKVIKSRCGQVNQPSETNSNRISKLLVKKKNAAYMGDTGAMHSVRNHVQTQYSQSNTQTAVVNSKGEKIIFSTQGQGSHGGNRLYMMDE